MKRMTRAFLTTALGVSLGLAAACADKGKSPDAAEAAPVEAKAKTDGKSELPEPPAVDLPLAEELLQKAEAAAGGKDAIGKIDSFYKEGKVSLKGQNIEGGLRAWWKSGDFYVENTILGVGKAEGGKKGEVIWMRDPINGLRQVDGVEAEQARWGSSLSLVGEWEKFFEQAKTVKEHELDGKKVYDVELTGKSGGTVTVTLDAESGLHVAQAYKQASPLGDTPVSVKFEDFREVAGVMIPHRHVMDASLATIVETLTKVEVNLEVDESKFALPTGGAETVKVPLEAAPQ